jgi:hypothetical protein
LDENTNENHFLSGSNIGKDMVKKKNVFDRCLDGEAAPAGRQDLFPREAERANIPSFLPSDDVPHWPVPLATPTDLKCIRETRKVLDMT